jgi:hypothetical protein
MVRAEGFEVTTNYRSTFIAVATDCKANCGTEPKPGTVGALQLALLRESPYRYTSDDLLFEVHAQRSHIADADRAGERELFFAKSRACLRASPLGKTYGWGMHHDAEGRVAAYGVESDDYGRLARDAGLNRTQAMRSKRA